MRTLTSSLTVGLLTSALAFAAGCGQDDALDLSDVPIATEDEKADIFFPGGSKYTWVRPSSTQIQCVRAPCPNAILNDVNLGQSQLSYGYDWRALKLSPSDQADLELKLGKTLLFGRYATARMSGESVQIYQVTRANPRVSEQSIDSVETDRYFSLKLTNPSCQTPPCGYTALLMNVQRTEQWSDINLDRLGLPQNARQQLISELQKGTAYVSTQNPSVMPATVTEAFRPYNAAPLPKD